MPVVTSSTPPGVDLALWEDVYVTWQHGTFSREAADAMIVLEPRLRRAHPDGHYALVIIEPDAPPPASEIRAMLSDRMSSNASRAMAVSMEQPGFRGALVRSVMTGLKVAARARHPMEIYSSVAECAAWLARQKGISTASWADTLTREVAAYRASRRGSLKSLP